MDIHQVTDPAALEAFHAIETAAHDHDHASLPAATVEELLPLLDGQERAGELALLYVGVSQDIPVGVLTLRLPTLDNLSSANLGLCVHPARRRAGVARLLLAFGIEEVQRRGRSRVFMEVPSGAEGSPAQALSLMDSVGAKPVLENYRRLLDLATHPVGDPLPAPDGYRVVQWVDRCPEAVVDGVAYLMGRMTIDSPMGEMDYEQEKWDANRYRANEQAAVARDRLRLATMIVHVESGAVAGVTDIGVNRSRPQIAYQWDTIVDPDHRGQRLGMVLKTWNHRHLVTEVPDVRFVNTWNAASNAYMVAVNDELGFEPVEKWTEYQLDL